VARAKRSANETFLSLNEARFRLARSCATFAQRTDASTRAKPAPRCADVNERSSFVTVTKGRTKWYTTWNFTRRLITRYFTLILIAVRSVSHRRVIATENAVPFVTGMQRSLRHRMHKKIWAKNESPSQLRECPHNVRRKHAEILTMKSPNNKIIERTPIHKQSERRAYACYTKLRLRNESVAVRPRNALTIWFKIARTPYPVRDALIPQVTPETRDTLWMEWRPTERHIGYKTRRRYTPIVVATAILYNVRPKQCRCADQPSN
jgi:hypothetical protein